MLLLIALSFNLTRSMKESIESALIPVPLCLALCLMVSQMSPGRWCFCMGVVFTVKSRWGTGGEYNFSTMEMLLLFIVAIDVLPHIRLMAVR